MFGIHPATFKRWLAQKRKVGRTAPLPGGHQKPCFEGPLLKALDRHVEQHVDTMLHELQEQFSDRLDALGKAIKQALDTISASDAEK